MIVSVCLRQHQNLSSKVSDFEAGNGYNTPYFGAKIYVQVCLYAGMIFQLQRFSLWAWCGL